MIAGKIRLTLLAITIATLAFSGPSAVQAQVCAGNVTLNSQAQVDAFSCTSVTGNLSVSGADITNLNALAGLTTTGGELRVQNCPILTNIDGLASVATVGTRLLLIDNPALANIDGLSSLTSTGELRIQNCNAVTDLDALGSLTSTGSDLLLIDNAGLSNIDGLSSITSVAGRLYVQNCDALPDVDGLSSLMNVGGSELVVRNNALLANCCGLYPLLTSGTVSGSITINNNLIGCNSASEIRAGCEPVQVNQSTWGRVKTTYR